MSRTYKKNAKGFIAGGNNTSFYRKRRQNIRRKNKSNLRYLIANKPIDEINDLILNDATPKTDKWREPTDGHFTINKEIIKNKDREFGYNDYYHNKFDHILKNKHYKH